MVVAREMHPMSKLRFFYTDYCDDKSIPSQEAWTASKDQILHSMDCVLHSPRNFIGIIDDRNVTLQFIVNDDRSIDVDIPSPSQRGSYVKTTGLAECLELVRELGETIQPDSIADMKFESW